MNLKKSAARAYQWSLLGELSSKLIAPVIFIILARLLTPEDFGVVAAATVAVSLSQVFCDSGVARALIQRSGGDATSADTALVINLGLGLVLMVTLGLAAPVVAEFFRDERIAPVLRILSIQLPLLAISAVMTALIHKRLEFRRLFWIRLTTTAIPGFGSIPLALTGWSYWALVAGLVVGALMQCIVLWFVVGETLRWRIDRLIARELMGFAKWSITSGLLGWMFGWVDMIVVGRFLGAHEMGLYRTANTFVIVVFGIIFSPLLPVLFSIFSRAQHEVPRLTEGLMKVANGIALVSVPIGFALFAMREELGEVIFGPAWDGVGIAIGMLALSHAVAWIGGANGEFYRAIGKPRIEAMTMLVALVIYLPSYLLAVQGGLTIFLWTRLALSAFALALHIGIGWIAVGIEPRRWLRISFPAFLAAVIATIVGLQVGAAVSDALTRIMLVVVVSGGAYLALIAVLERRYLAESLRSFR